MNTALSLSTGRADTSVETMQSLLTRLHETFINDDLTDELEEILAVGAPLSLSTHTRQTPNWPDTWGSW